MTFPTAEELELVTFSYGRVDKWNEDIPNDSKAVFLTTIEHRTKEEVKSLKQQILSDHEMVLKLNEYGINTTHELNLVLLELPTLKQIVERIEKKLFEENGQTQYITKWDYEQIKKSILENKNV